MPNNDIEKHPADVAGIDPDWERKAEEAKAEREKHEDGDSHDDE